MTNTKDVIIRLKEVRDEKGLSYNDILSMISQNGDYPISRSTLSRVFSEGSEDLSFKYEETIRPIANALLDIENLEDDDNMDTKAQKIKHNEKMDAERAAWSRSIDFLKEQVSLKDKRMDFLLDAVQKKDQLHQEMLNKLLKCSCCTMKEGG